MNDLNGFYRLADGRELKRKLKERFGFNFSVRQRGRWYHVNWQDGPGLRAVNSFLSHFHDNGRNDIMTDLYCGSQYIIAQRSTSKELDNSFLSYLQVRFGWPLSFGAYGLQIDDPACGESMAESIRREFQHLISVAEVLV